jgi:hypothetical protein
VSDRAAVVSAIQGSRNLERAAVRLDVSRKTLYNRMREYQLPAGKSGRPRRLLGSESGQNAAVGLGALAIIGLVGYLIYRMDKSVTRVSGHSKTADLRGLDAIIR